MLGDFLGLKFMVKLGPISVVEKMMKRLSISGIGVRGVSHWLGHGQTWPILVRMCHVVLGGNSNSV